MSKPKPTEEQVKGAAVKIGQAMSRYISDRMWAASEARRRTPVQAVPDYVLVEPNIIVDEGGEEVLLEDD